MKEFLQEKFFWKELCENFFEIFMRKPGQILLLNKSRKAMRIFEG